MANTVIPSTGLIAQGVPGQEDMPQAEIMDTAGESRLKVGGVLILNNSSGVAVTLSSDITSHVGSRWWITALDQGGSGNTVTLPSGVTWDGTNDVATFDADGETLVTVLGSATRMYVISNPDSVAFS